MKIYILQKGDNSLRRNALFKNIDQISFWTMKILFQSENLNNL